VAKKYWNPENLAVVIVGKTSDFGAPLSTLGQVTMVDITIPKPKGAEVAAATTQTLGRGKDLLAKTRIAMGGDKLAGIKDYTMKSTLIVAGPQGEMSLKQENTYKLSGKSIQKISTPMGDMTQVFDGEKIWAKTPQGVQDAPPQMAAAARQDIKRENIALLTNPGLTAQSLGSSKLGDKQVEGLLLTDPASKMEVKLYIDPATSLIAGKSYSTPTGPGEIQEVYNGFKDVGGVKFPAQIVVSQNGKKRAEAKIDDIQINTNVADSLFAKP
jgi:hypothetical protein